MAEEAGREPLQFDHDLRPVIAQICEGNPGAIRVMMCMLEKFGTIEGFMRILDLNDMNMRGPQIWVAYKEWAGHDLEKLKEGIRQRNEDLVATVNEMCAHRGQEAITHGASRE